MPWTGLGVLVMVVGFFLLLFSGAGDHAFSYSQFMVVGAILFAAGMIAETVTHAEAKILAALKSPGDEKKTHQ